MKNRRIIIAIVVVVIVGIAVWIVRQRSGAPAQVDLIETFPNAEKRDNGRKGFRVIDAMTVNGEAKRAITAVVPSRIIWRMKIPRDAWLRTFITTHPDTWTKEGNGVLFRVGVSDGETYEDLIVQHVNPLANESDRRWIPVELDLSAYSDRQVEVIFNAENSPRRQKPDKRNDVPLWGTPQITR